MKNRAPASLSCLDVLTSSLFKCIGIAIDTSISYHKTLLIHCIIPRTRVNKTISRLWANGFCFFFQNLTKHLITLLSRVNIETWHTKPSINHGYPLNNCFLWKSNTMKKNINGLDFVQNDRKAHLIKTQQTHTHTQTVSVLCAITPIASIEASNVSHANFPTVWLEQSQNGIRSRKLCLSKLSFDCNRGIATFILSKWALVCCLNEKRPSHFRLAVRCMEYFFCGQNQTFYWFYHCINGS